MGALDRLGQSNRKSPVHSGWGVPSPHGPLAQRTPDELNRSTPDTAKRDEERQRSDKMRCRLPRTASLITVLTVASIVAPGSAYFGLTGKEPLAVLSTPVLEDFGAGKVHLKQCDTLKLFRRQKRLCRREPGLAEGLRDAIRLSALECRYQFRSERWNCSLEGRGSLIKRGFKETAFLFAISSAGLTHSLAKACSSGRMERCTCDESPDLENKETWQWGGCGDNLKYSIKFIKHFLGQRKTSKDLRARVDMHNSNVGIKAVKSGLKTTCKCHGVSGSCAVRTCWKQLSSFHDTGKFLKLKYETAVRVHSVTNDATGETELISPKKHSYTLKNHIPRTTDLVYIEDSPSFCRPSKYSPGTAGRVCSKETNCESMCCGQGYNTQSLLVHRPCHCQVQWCCYVECQQCSQREEIYTCKH